VGETLAEREADATAAVIARQVESAFAGVRSEQVAQCVIAYEPVWAIGTGRNATPEQAEEAIVFIRSLLAHRDQAAADAVRILYGGSVTPENAAELLGRDGVDGALVGGASLDPASYLTIAAEASR
jgi:triosephosphate isomerase